MTVEDMSTPQLVRIFVEIKMSNARGEPTNDIQHRRLGRVVNELRERNVLERHAGW